MSLEVEASITTNGSTSSSSNIKSNIIITTTTTDELNHPKNNWEVAYVYAFLLKFTDLQSTSSTTSILHNEMDLEEALLSSSPPPSSLPPPALLPPSSPTSSLSSHKSETIESTSTLLPTPISLPISKDEEEIKEEINIPPSSELLIEIIKTFQLNLPESSADNSHSRQRKDWFGWLFRWCKNRLLERHSGGLNWFVQGRGHIMKRLGVKTGKEEEKEFWLLTWEDKIHLLRCLVDWQLTYSPQIRTLITSSYNLLPQRIINRDPSSNPLIIEPLGILTKSKMTLWSFGDIDINGEGEEFNVSSRLYGSGNPFKVDGGEGWKGLSSTKEEFKDFFEGLKKGEEEIIIIEDDQDKVVEGGEDGKTKMRVVKGDPFSKAKEAAERRKQLALEKEKEKKKGKKKVISEDDLNEMSIRKKLEARLNLIEEGELALVNLALKRSRAIDRALAKETRSLDSNAFMYRPSLSTRSTRLRTQINNYNESNLSSPPSKNSKPEEDSEESEPEEPEEEEEEEEGSGSGENTDEESYGIKSNSKNKKRNRIVIESSEEEEDSDGEKRISKKKKKKNAIDNEGRDRRWEGERRSSRFNKEVEVEVEAELKEEAVVPEVIVGERKLEKEVTEDIEMNEVEALPEAVKVVDQVAPIAAVVAEGEKVMVAEPEKVVEKEVVVEKEKEVEVEVVIATN